MVEITENKKIKLTAFILSKTGILESLFENFANNEKMTFDEESKAMRITCNFIKDFIECNTRKLGNVYYIGYMAISPYDTLEIFENFVINTHDVKRAICILNETLDAVFGLKYNLKIKIDL